MFKKILNTSVLGVSVLGAMAANAAAPGVYVTGQVGYANTQMGNKTDTANLLHNKDKAEANNLSNNGLAGRLALGYQFNQNFAVEVGYLQLGQRKVNVLVSPEQSSLKLRQNALDLVGKGIIPVSNNIDVYGKLGVAYLTSDIKETVKEGGHSTTTYDLNDVAGVNKHQWAPEAAIGVTYDITPNVSVDTSWTHIQPLGKNRPGNIDFVAVGLGYNFG
ncbi:MAG: outer membrane beta-barrel protein [Candidatus Rickettsiella isopodorum]|jgi:opacity protein-like surface antigen|nr:outer membrane beta-barrel protein [Gammaproteobacteria bacterium]MDD5161858.1 outer membrane beta-barrel protein [Candidatus Rickettsiella isopodorum]MDQ5899756.1 OmpA rane protein [Pseudomonadota bacterium]